MSVIGAPKTTKKEKKTNEHDYVFYEKMQDKMFLEACKNFMAAASGNAYNFDDPSFLNKIVDKKNIDFLRESLPVFSDDYNGKFMTVTPRSLNYDFKNNSYVFIIDIEEYKNKHNGKIVEFVGSTHDIKYGGCSDDHRIVVELIDYLCTDLRYALAEHMRYE